MLIRNCQLLQALAVAELWQEKIEQDCEGVEDDVNRCENH
jgi:hypothetical protein